VGVGDVLGMAATHAIASGMGGMRTAGDLVARMQMSRRMRIRQAKEYVAGRLKIGLSDLSDPLIMSEVREDLKTGSRQPASPLRGRDRNEVPYRRAPRHRDPGLKLFRKKRAFRPDNGRVPKGHPSALEVCPGILQKVFLDILRR